MVDERRRLRIVRRQRDAAPRFRLHREGRPADLVTGLGGWEEEEVAAALTAVLAARRDGDSREPQLVVALPRVPVGAQRTGRLPAHAGPDVVDEILADR